ncbi:hypothetical protein AB0H18_38320 [Streptomyces sp. NPDC020766]|uniref:hypothetical protein n=1 Tax=Streptomyces sp. NPDC020766 TaxID=3155011 RepID=UPI0034027AB5
MEGPAELRPYPYRVGVLDLEVASDAPAGALVRVVVDGSVRRLRIFDSRPRIHVAAVAGVGIPPRVTVLLPDQGNGRLPSLAFRGLHVDLQGWPDELVLESESKLVTVPAGTLGRLRVTGPACLEGDARVDSLCLEEGHSLDLAGVLRTRRIAGESVVVGGHGESACLHTDQLHDDVLLSIGAGARIVVEPDPGEADAHMPSGVRIAGPGFLELRGGGLDRPHFGDPAGLVLGSRARVLAAQGTLASLAMRPGCLLHGDPSTGVEVRRVREVAGAELAEVSAFTLDQLALTRLGEAAHVAFWAGANGRDGAVRARAMRASADDRYLAAYWAALLRTLEERGASGGVRMTARHAEMDYRRRAQSWRSTDRWMLEFLRPIRYGQSVAAPLVAQLVVATVGALLLHAIGMIPDSSGRGFLVMIPRLYFAPLGLTGNVDALNPGQLPGVWDTAVWLAALLTGFLFFPAAALAARRRIVYL